jgi:hypothetical protein
MATAAQVRANRSNAQKSTGPRTAEGKAAVAENAVKHGLLARAAVLQGEDWEEFTEFRENLLEELSPDGTLEVLLAERIVSLSWRLQRAARLQNEAYESLYLKEATSTYGKMMRAEMAKGRPAGPETGTDDLVTGRVLVADFGGAKVLDRMLLYERRIEHSLYRTMGELKKLRLRRGLEPATTERGEGVSSWKSEVSSEEGQSLPTFDFNLHTSSEPPCGVTTNGVADSTGAAASPLGEGEIPGGQEPAVGAALPSRAVEAAGRESESDFAKQSQFGADQSAVNLSWCGDLRPEEGVGQPQEQSQSEGDLASDGLSFSRGERGEAAFHPRV